MVVHLPPVPGVKAKGRAGDAVRADTALMLTWWARRARATTDAPLVHTLADRADRASDDLASSGVKGRHAAATGDAFVTVARLYVLQQAGDGDAGVAMALLDRLARALRRIHTPAGGTTDARVSAYFRTQPMGAFTHVEPVELPEVVDLDVALWPTPDPDAGDAAEALSNLLKDVNDG